MENSQNKAKQEYNEEAQNYTDQRNEFPYYEHLEIPSTLKFIGEIKNKSFMDIACGPGNYAILLKEMGASKVVASDISEEMIIQAKDAAITNNVQIDFQVYDSTNLPFVDKFDCITAIYLLHYFSDSKSLKKLAESVKRNLKSGGKFVTLVTNPGVCTNESHYKKYGFCATELKEKKNGTPYSLCLTKLNQKITIYYWTKSAINEIFQKAGFVNIQWHDPIISDEGIKLYGKKYWQNLIDIPWSLYLTMEKA